MNKVACCFIKLNALLAAKRMLTVLSANPDVELSEVMLTQAWDVLYDLSGMARPAEGWNPGTWTRLQAVNR